MTTYEERQEALDQNAEFLEHFGVKGMKWGVQNALTAKRRIRLTPAGVAALKVGAAGAGYLAFVGAGKAGDQFLKERRRTINSKRRASAGKLQTPMDKKHAAAKAKRKTTRRVVGAGALALAGYKGTRVLLARRGKIKAANLDHLNGRKVYDAFLAPDGKQNLRRKMLSMPMKMLAA